MQGFEVIINGKSYPCRVTMGAMRRYKLATGREMTDVDFNSVSMVAEMLYCCVASASNADKVPFQLSIDDFCDAISIEYMTELAGQLVSPDGAVEQKKTV